MAFIVRQIRTLKAYCCLRGLENEVTSDICLAPLKGFILSSLSEIYFLFILSLISANSAAAHS